MAAVLRNPQSRLGKKLLRLGKDRQWDEFFETMPLGTGKQEKTFRPTMKLGAARLRLEDVFDDTRIRDLVAQAQTENIVAENALRSDHNHQKGLKNSRQELMDSRKTSWNFRRAGNGAWDLVFVKK